MRINSINTYSKTFKGKAYVNYYGIAHNVQASPYPTQQSIIGNINSLKQRLESQTPADKTFIINYGYTTQKDSIFLPTQHYGTIKVSDEKGNTIVQEFDLGKSGGSRKDDRTIFASGEEIWHNGFRPITEMALNGIQHQSSKDEKAMEEIKAEIKKRGWVEEDIKPWRNPHYEAIGAATEQDLAEIKAIYDRIEDRARVKMDKADIAVSLWRVTSKEECPEEILDSIIGNINTLTQRVENETAKEKLYHLSVSNLFGYNDGYEIDSSYGYHGSTIRIDLSSGSSYYKGYITTSSLSDEKGKWRYYCPTDSEKIYNDVFKPITEKTLWDGHNHLPFNKDWEKREIVNQLV